eukprot:TRINITY_DN13732_c0_g1_i1.p1 TRINITY_DN13732_c0_g1~~TRINITY_DN13732_c0_g1_i1.p1  ORF type:complete len:637 (-),score=91.88 TRINITY_DN13732_c0_g1_i1:112-2022(-)
MLWQRRWISEIWRKMDIRFEEEGIEAEYQKHIRDDIVLGSSMFYATGTVGTILELVRLFIQKGGVNKQRFNLTHADGRVVTIAAAAFVALMLLAFAVAGILYMKKRIFADHNWERWTLAVATAVVVIWSFCNTWQGPTLWGDDPKQVWEHDTYGDETVHVLALQALMACTAMYIPIRSCLLWVLALAMCLHPVMRIFTGCPFPDNLSTVSAAQFSLTFFSFHSAYRNEVHRRETFLAAREVQALKVVIKDSSEVESTMVDMVETLCDVFAKLTSELRVIGKHPKLDRLLERDMSGRQLTDILNEGDEFRLLEMLERTKQSPVLAPMTLQKKQTGTIEVHIVLARLECAHGLQYLLGIRLDSETMQNNHASNHEYGVLAGSSAEPALHVEEKLHAAATGSAQPTGRLNSVSEDNDEDNHEDNEQLPEAPDFTCEGGMDKSLRFLLRRWHVPRDVKNPKRYCAWHDAASQLSRAAKRLKASPCNPLWASFSGWPCSRCLCIRPNKIVFCAVCDSAGSQEASSSIRKHSSRGCHHIVKEESPEGEKAVTAKEAFSAQNQSEGEKAVTAKEAFSAQNQSEGEKAVTAKEAFSAQNQSEVVQPGVVIHPLPIGRPVHGKASSGIKLFRPFDPSSCVQVQPH